jgi:phosphoglucosamine mutase
MMCNLKIMFRQSFNTSSLVTSRIDPPTHLFGTDGIRGVVNGPVINPELLLRLSLVMAAQLSALCPQPRVIVGYDTRDSAAMIKSAVAAGFLASGWMVDDVGIVPTPGLAFLTRDLQAQLGIMISASHNPPHDNGLKFFDATGLKLSDEIEQSVERAVLSSLEASMVVQPAHVQTVGRMALRTESRDRYVTMLERELDGCDLAALRIVVDCAHGAAFDLLPSLLEAFGAQIVRLGCEPRGDNINVACGSTYPEAMIKAVVQHGAHLGVCLDGDGDRVVLCDEQGQLADGDQILACLAREDLAQGRMQAGDSVVGTVMTNGGLEHHLQSMGLHLVRAPVGDRYVLQHMKACGAGLGGEPSGHIIIGKEALTGDGLLTVLRVLKIAVRSSQQTHLRPISQFLRSFHPWPQKLHNIRTQSSPRDVLQDPELLRLIDQKCREHAGVLHVLVRSSGTEPLVRVMAQGQSSGLVEQTVNELVGLIQRFDQHLTSQSAQDAITPKAVSEKSPSQGV